MGIERPEPLKSRVAWRKDSSIQVKTVLLISLTVLSRKRVLREPDTCPAKIGAASAALLTLGIVYWLLRERDDRFATSAREKAESAGE